METLIWIPTNVAMPEESEPVVWFGRGGGQVTGRYQRGKWINSEGREEPVPSMWRYV